MPFFKQYASFLKENYLHDVATLYLSYVYQLEVPLLNHFRHLTQEQLIESSEKGILELLTDFEHGTALEKVKEGIQKWEEDKIEGLPQGAVEAADLILINSAQEMALTEFISRFTEDCAQVIQIAIQIKQHYAEAQRMHFDALFKIRKKAEDALKESEERFRSFSQSAADGIMILNEDLEIIFWNKGAEMIFGYYSDEITNRKVNAVIPERLRQRFVERIQRLSDAGEKDYIESFESTGLHKSGKEIPVDVSASTWLTKKGRFYSYIIHNITERKRTEELLKLSNQELEQFAYVASHDLKEPLRMVSNYLQLLEMRYSDKLDDEAQTYIDFAVGGAKRMDSLIGALLNYSRLNTRKGDFEKVDLDEVVNNILSNLSQVIGERGANVKVDDLPVILADRVQMNQLFQNLIANALKFTKEAPEVSIHAKKLRDSLWQFAVKDNGIGIDEKFASRIFIMFQRLHTADEYPGTGMGLSICKKIVERHGGKIWFESEIGKGTTFYFTLEGEYF